MAFPCRTGGRRLVTGTGAGGHPTMGPPGSQIHNTESDWGGTRHGFVTPGQWHSGRAAGRAWQPSPLSLRLLGMRLTHLLCILRSLQRRGEEL